MRPCNVCAYWARDPFTNEPHHPTCPVRGAPAGDAFFVPRGLTRININLPPGTPSPRCDGNAAVACVLVTEGHLAGWIVYRHVDGGFVTLRRATAEDRAALVKAGIITGD